MKHPLKLALIVTALAFGIIVVALAIDTACISSGIASCRVWNGFQWESIVAGTLGLMGGIFVIAAARHQVSTMNQHRSDQVAQPLETTLDVIVNTKKNLQEIQHLLHEENNNAWGSDSDKEKIDEWARTVERSAFILHRRMDHLNKLISTHGTTSYNFSSYTNLVQLTELSQRIISNRSHPDYFSMQKEKQDLLLSAITDSLDYCEKCSLSISQQIQSIKSKYMGDN